MALSNDVRCSRSIYCMVSYSNKTILFQPTTLLTTTGFAQKSSSPRRRHTGKGWKGRGSSRTSVLTRVALVNLLVSAGKASRYNITVRKEAIAFVSDQHVSPLKVLPPSLCRRHHSFCFRVTTATHRGKDAPSVSETFCFRGSIPDPKAD